MRDAGRRKREAAVAEEGEGEVEAVEVVALMIGHREEEIAAGVDAVVEER